MSLTLITPATTESVTLAEAKRQCRVHSSDTTYDDELQAYLDAAVSHVQTITRTALEPSEWSYAIDAFPDGDVTLPFGPVISVESVGYYLDDVLETFAAENYSVRQISDYRAEIVPVSGWPTTDSGVARVVIEFTAGFEGETVGETYVPASPAALRQAILLLVGHWFRNRSAVEVVSSGDLVSVPLAFDALVEPYKWRVLA